MAVWSVSTAAARGTWIILLKIHTKVIQETTRLEFLLFNLLQKRTTGWQNQRKGALWFQQNSFFLMSRGH